MNPFIHHRDDVSGVWNHRMMLHHSTGEALKNDMSCGSCKKELGRLAGFSQWGVGWGTSTLCEKCVGIFHQQRSSCSPLQCLLQTTKRAALLSSSKGKHCPPNTSYSSSSFRIGLQSSLHKAQNFSSGPWSILGLHWAVPALLVAQHSFPCLFPDYLLWFFIFIAVENQVVKNMSEESL